MIKRRGFKYFLAVFGFVALFAAGYMATSVVTSCTADAQVCCQSTCIAPWQGITAPLAEVTVGIAITGIAYTILTVGAFYALTLGEFAIKVIEEVGTINRHWLNWWDTFWGYSLHPALQDMSRQLAALDVDQARAIGSFNDMLQRNRIIKKRLARESKSHTTERPGENVCVAGTLSTGLGQADLLTQAYNAAAPTDMLNRSGNTLGSPAAGGTASEIDARFRTYVTRYCDPLENEGNAGCTVAGAHPGADRDVPGQIFQKLTIDLKDPDVKQTIDDLVTNVAEPFVKDRVPSSAFDTAAGQEEILENESYKTQRQAIHDALYHIIARRAPTSSLSPFTIEIHDAAGVNLANVADPRRDWQQKEMADNGKGGLVRKAYAQPAAPALPPASKNEAMEALVNEKPRDGKFATGQIDEPQNNAREGAVQAGIRTRQLSDMLDLVDRYSLIVAGQVGNEIKQDRPRDGRYTSQPMQ
jgi:hypothetical protein